MPRYVAFLRAINVGGHTVTMTVLRRHFADLGCSEVETVIASGNVVFDAPSRSPAALEKRIAAHLETRLGYAVATFLRTPAEVAHIAAHRPFSRSELEAPGHGLYIGFLASVPGAGARRGVLALENPADSLRLRGRELYWLRRGGFSDSKMSGSALEKALGQPATLRNATTVGKIAAKYA
jgi:uncharacterized protein (DUF1697 family)